MIKQSNMNFYSELSTNLTKTKNQSMDNNSICQRFATRHGLLVPTRKQESKSMNTSHIHQIQETNINPTVIDGLEKSSSHCPLIEAFYKDKLNNCETKQNLTKLQKLTDDVKLLTKQVQLSNELNKNNNSSSSILDEHLLGEICYQVERRILLLIFSKSKHLYGYSLRYLSLIIENEENKHNRLIYKKRFLQIEKYLLQTNFQFNYHPILTFYFINKYGIYSDYQWLQNLSNLNQIKSVCYSLISKKYHQDLSIILDSLQLISNIDNKPLFYW